MKLYYLKSVVTDALVFQSVRHLFFSPNIFIYGYHLVFDIYFYFPDVCFSDILPVAPIGTCPKCDFSFYYYYSYLYIVDLKYYYYAMYKYVQYVRV